MISIRSEIEGTVELFQIKVNRARKVVLPGGVIFIRWSHPKSRLERYDLPKPQRLSFKPKTGLVLKAANGEEIESGEDLIVLLSESDGAVRLDKNQVIVEKGGASKAHELLKGMEPLVKKGQTVKVGTRLAAIQSEFDGVVRYVLDSAEPSANDKYRKVVAVEVLNGVAYLCPDDFTLKVAQGQKVGSGQILAEGVVREEGYESLALPGAEGGDDEEEFERPEEDEGEEPHEAEPPEEDFTDKEEPEEPEEPEEDDY